jgi:hypothetical protein
MKKTKYVGFRVSIEEFSRLEMVQEHIAISSRGQRPEISDILRSIIGWGNRKLVSAEERAYLAGDIPRIGESDKPEIPPPVICPMPVKESQKLVRKK